MNILSDTSRPWLALAMLPGIGGGTLRAIAHSGKWDRTSKSLEEISIALQLPKLAKALETPGALQRAEKEAYNQVKMAMRYGAKIVSSLDDDFPQLLKQSRYNPFFLYVRGNLRSSTSNASLAIVGTRNPTDQGKKTARSLAQEAVANGWSVVSGLARGCDTYAHKGAIENNGHTVAVLAHGLHTVQPYQNQDLAKAILDKGGALVSHFPFGVDAEPKYFVQRDAIQSGLAQGVILVQSDINGGSLHAARAALADKRWLWTAPVAAQDKMPDEGHPPSCIRANEVLLTGSVEEKQTLLKIKEVDSMHFIMSADTPSPGAKPHVQANERTATSSRQP